jgi:hypothetical protein
VSPAEPVSVAMAVVTIVDKMGGWSVGGVFSFVCITPAIFVYLAARLVSKANDGLRKQIAATEKESAKRFQVFRNDYNNNIRFVEDYSKLANGLDDTLRRNTIVMTKLVDRLNTIREMK